MVGWGVDVLPVAIADDDVTGTVADDDVTGTVADDDVTGTVADDDVAGLHGGSCVGMSVSCSQTQSKCMPMLNMNKSKNYRSPVSYSNSNDKQ